MSVIAESLPAPLLPLTPMEEEWHKMSAEERDRFITETTAMLTAQAELSPEGRPHNRAKNQALDKLGRHFQRTGRTIYLAGELPVYYPGERTFAPDLLAILDVEDPGEKDERRSWMVADEGRGLDLVLEVYCHGDWRKDSEDNVTDYARMGIPEYFLYDRRRQALHGYRLPSPGARRYQKLRPHFGRLKSEVLGLELAVHHGRLHLYSGDAELPDSDELLERVQHIVDDVQQRLDQAERAAREAEARADRLLGQLRAAVLNILSIRGLTVSAELAQQVATCTDDALLSQWQSRAMTVASAAELADPANPTQD